MSQRNKSSLLGPSRSLYANQESFSIIHIIHDNQTTLIPNYALIGHYFNKSWLLDNYYHSLDCPCRMKFYNCSHQLLSLLVSHRVQLVQQSFQFTLPPQYPISRSFLIRTKLFLFHPEGWWFVQTVLTLCIVVRRPPACTAVVLHSAGCNCGPQPFPINRSSFGRVQKIGQPSSTPMVVTVITIGAHWIWTRFLHICTY